MVCVSEWVIDITKGSDLLRSVVLSLSLLGFADLRSATQRMADECATVGQKHWIDDANDDDADSIVNFHRILSFCKIDSESVLPGNRSQYRFITLMPRESCCGLWLMGQENGIGWTTIDECWWSLKLEQQCLRCSIVNSDNSHLNSMQFVFILRIGFSIASDGN